MRRTRQVFIETMHLQRPALVPMSPLSLYCLWAHIVSLSHPAYCRFEWVIGGWWRTDDWCWCWIRVFCAIQYELMLLLFFVHSPQVYYTHIMHTKTPVTTLTRPNTRVVAVVSNIKRMSSRPTPYKCTVVRFPHSDTSLIEFIVYGTSFLCVFWNYDETVPAIAIFLFLLCAVLG